MAVYLPIIFKDKLPCRVNSVQHQWSSCLSAAASGPVKNYYSWSLTFGVKLKANTALCQEPLIQYGTLACFANSKLKCLYQGMYEQGVTRFHPVPPCTAYINMIRPKHLVSI
jgi:hypothetical protein